MSIINDALKKVQQGLNPKPDQPQENPPTTNQNASGYLYATPPVVETLPPSKNPQAPSPKKPLENRIKSILAFMCALVIFVGAFWYMFHQLNINIPQLKRTVHKSIYKMIYHKDLPPEFKTKTPRDYVPLARITINAPQTAALPAANTETPLTLNIHGVMADGSKNLVLIDNQVYQEGDEVDGIKIVKIGLDFITIDNNGVEQQIRVQN